MRCWLVGWLRFTRFVSFRTVPTQQHAFCWSLQRSFVRCDFVVLRHACVSSCLTEPLSGTTRQQPERNKKPNPQTEVVSFRLDATRSTRPWCVRVPHRPCGVGIRPTGFRSVPFVCCSCFPFRPRWRPRCWLLIIGVDSIRFDSKFDSTRRLSLCFYVYSIGIGVSRRQPRRFLVRLLSRVVVVVVVSLSLS